MWRIFRTAQGEATKEDIDLLSEVTKQIEGHTICAFGEGSVACTGFVKTFRKEMMKDVFQNL